MGKTMRRAPVEAVASGKHDNKDGAAAHVLASGRRITGMAEGGQPQGGGLSMSIAQFFTNGSWISCRFRHLVAHGAGKSGQLQQNGRTFVTCGRVAADRPRGAGSPLSCPIHSPAETCRSVLARVISRWESNALRRSSARCSFDSPPVQVYNHPIPPIQSHVQRAMYPSIHFATTLVRDLNPCNSIY
jgi:hypothetical protein